ncbi:UDP-4-amino-4,6-dideoxy-N-acetyl-beta-L-altrosamine N-acetyltransferase [Brevundimonas sp. Leaf168]|uniref:UDP-4-amino-4, 6-dideoxy-N-acetyl-beta-L-altrosamine N-acetyltransferase n=1 Tax=Brevundimonas sp. Leaf168 TaxID=1736283 RepID=UPI00070028FD|nr:UDP-4-amino-4,6-dideoxy-N-acetyl-beta-L-altrosamine N-acetyltransferase [Brevundimonas sp. Leaf168]KQR56222.1 hypothetical protein ASF81_07105 [Brevundimonas sp. Leaf168]
MSLQTAMSYGGLRLTPFAFLNEEQKVFVWEMRTHPQVARWMATAGEISLANHLAYMARQAGDLLNANYLAFDNAGVVGVVSLHRIDAAIRTADLGIYRNPFRTEKGLGNSLLAAICEVAFGPGNVEIFRLEVASDNVTAISLYRKAGFILHGSCEKNTSLLSMTLARADWAEQQEIPNG